MAAVGSPEAVISTSAMPPMTVNIGAPHSSAASMTISPSVRSVAGSSGSAHSARPAAATTAANARVECVSLP